MLTPEPAELVGQRVAEQPEVGGSRAQVRGNRVGLLDLVLAGQHLLPHEPPHRVADLTERRLVHGHLSSHSPASMLAPEFP